MKSISSSLVYATFYFHILDTFDKLLYFCRMEDFRSYLG